MEYLIFIGFVALFIFLILKTNLFPTDFVSKKFILGIAVLKGVISIIYGQLSLQNNWVDTYGFYRGGEIIARLLPENPKAYFYILTHNEPVPLPTSWIELIGRDDFPFGALTRSGFIARFHALLHPITNSFYPTHAIIFSFLSLMGIFYICYIFYKISPKSSFLSKIFIYFTPSILFWTSGAHKDALITFGLGMMLHTFYKLWVDKKFIYIFGFLFACAFSYYARNYTFYLFLPGLVTFGIAHCIQKKISPFITYSILMLSGILFFFIAPQLHPKLNFLNKFIAVQEHFLTINGNSSFSMKALEPTAQSFLIAFPKALWHSVTKPNLSYTGSPFAIYAAIENFILIGLTIIALLFINIKKITRSQLNGALLCLGYGFFFYTLLGLTVANIGALVRYKSVGLIFIQMGFILLVDTDKIIQTFNKISPLKIKQNGNR